MVLHCKYDFIQQNAGSISIVKSSLLCNRTNHKDHSIIIIHRWKERVLYILFFKRIKDMLKLSSDTKSGLNVKEYYKKV